MNRISLFPVVLSSLASTAMLCTLGMIMHSRNFSTATYLSRRLPEIPLLLVLVLMPRFLSEYFRSECSVTLWRAPILGSIESWIALIAGFKLSAPAAPTKHFTQNPPCVILQLSTGMSFRPCHKAQVAVMICSHEQQLTFCHNQSE